MTRAYLRQAYYNIYAGGIWPDTTGGVAKQPQVTIATNGNGSDVNGPFQTNPTPGVAPAIFSGGFMQNAGYHSGLVYVGPSLSAGTFDGNIALQCRQYHSRGSAAQARLVFFVYVWRSSSGTRISGISEAQGGIMGVGLTTATALAALGTTTVQAGDRVIVEVWAHTAAPAGGDSYRAYRDTDQDFFEYSEPLAAITIGPGGATGTSLAVGATPDRSEDFGLDVSTFPDLPAGLPLMRGRQVLAQAMLRRLTTPRGLLRFHPDYGLNLRDFLNEGVTDAVLHRLKADIEAEAEKDERVFRANSVLSYSRRNLSLRVALELETGVGPYRLVLLITRVSADVLET